MQTDHPFGQNMARQVLKCALPLALLLLMTGCTIPAKVTYNDTPKNAEIVLVVDGYSYPTMPLAILNKHGIEVTDFFIDTENPLEHTSMLRFEVTTYRNYSVKELTECFSEGGISCRSISVIYH